MVDISKRKVVALAFGAFGVAAGAALLPKALKSSATNIANSGSDQVDTLIIDSATQNMQLTGSGTQLLFQSFVGGAYTTAFSIDGGASSFGNLLSTSQAATASSTLMNSPVFDYRGAYWNGSASVNYGFRVFSVQDSTTPTAHLSFNLNNNGTITELVRITQAAIEGLRISDWTAGGGYIGIGALGLAESLGNYALLQQSDGTTYLNAAASKIIHFRVSNTDQATIDGSGRMGLGTAIDTAASLAIVAPTASIGGIKITGDGSTFDHTWIPFTDDSFYFSGKTGSSLVWRTGFPAVNQVVFSGSGIITAAGIKTASQTVTSPWFGTPTGSRALATVYQNLTGKNMLVIVTVTCNPTINLNFICDSSSTPTTGISSSGNPVAAGGNSVPCIVVGIVPNNYYYKVTGGTTLSIWAEYTC